MTRDYIITLRCADQRGIVKTVADSVFESRGNIVDSAQFWDQPSNSFSLRMHVTVPQGESEALRANLESQLSRFDPILTIRPTEHKRKVLVLVSKADHCLRELLHQWDADELGADIVGVVSNHTDLQGVTEHFGVPFHHIPVTADSKPEAEARLTAVYAESGADFIVLARYMQVLSDGFCAQHEGQIINIHHSFLPGFKGAKPYHQAYDRGVKLIGATAHYVTGDLDEGPIIEQDVVRVSHRHSAENLVSIGRDVERRVLARAVRLHADDRVFPNGARTVVFDD
ncbi:formyltetrahydrofolate deformylase [Microbacteriaceae bacterium MWH-Ta3]|nr:formyltetrahydrofolate deformylase [Microbacteriaceae bacterium MWH-Ta3]